MNERKSTRVGQLLFSILPIPMLLMICATTSAQTMLTESKPDPIDFSDRVVTYPASDGVLIEADYYPVQVEEGKKTPVAVLIHMYPADRSSWKPFIPRLREAGIAVLAYDIRGTGGSIKPEERNLETGYESKDAMHFSFAWMDLEGARVWLEKQRNIDLKKMVVIGASVGCSISLDYAKRHPETKAVVCLSPGTNYMGLNSIEHIKACSTVPILLIAPEGEYEAVKELVEASGGKAKAKKYPGGSDNHGTGMFDADYGKRVQKTMMSFVRKNLGIKKAKKKSDETKKDRPKKKKTKKKKPEADD